MKEVIVLYNLNALLIALCVSCGDAHRWNARLALLRHLSQSPRLPSSLSPLHLCSPNFSSPYHWVTPLALPAGKTVQCVAFCAAVLGKMGNAEDAVYPQIPRLNRIQAPADG